MAIDVGPGVGDYPASYGARTFICAGNPANDTGTIDHVETYFSGTGAGIEAAAFANEGGAVFSTNGHDLMGDGSVADGFN